MARQDAEIPQKMQPGRWHRGHQASEQVERFEHERARAVSPNLQWDDQALYCSELAYKLFDRAAGVALGKLQTAAEMT